MGAPIYIYIEREREREREREKGEEGGRERERERERERSLLLLGKWGMDKWENAPKNGQGFSSMSTVLKVRVFCVWKKWNTWSPFSWTGDHPIEGTN